MKKYYLAPVFGCVDPEPLIGPFNTFDELLAEAKKVKHSNSNKDALFYIVQEEGGHPCLKAFTYNSQIGD